MKKIIKTDVVDSYKKIPAMSPPVVFDYLREVGRAWQHQGVAIELGSWLGATARPLLEGLVEAGYDQPFYAYDRWSANKAEVEKAKRQGVKIGCNENLLPLFLSNVGYKNVEAHRGPITETIKSYPGDPIEICVFDAPKQDPVFKTAIDALIPYWIPGVTVLGLLDYYFYNRKKSRNERRPFLAPVKFIKSHPESFTKLAEWPGQTCAVFFRYEKKL